MMRSLFSGVSGLMNHQTRMDVIGNNIANVNTIGFKASRVNFQDVLSQTIQGASAASDGRGGVNAVQIGLGVGLASIDTMFTDGSTQGTGRQTDLAIQGSGFFILNDGVDVNTNYYTRAGNFDFDTNGNLVVPGTGYKVMGWMADATGHITPGSVVEPIRIVPGIESPPNATSYIQFDRNLSSAAALGTSVQASVTVYDSEGKTHRLDTTYTKVGDNTWLYKIDSGDGAIVPAYQMGEIVFDASGKNIISNKTLKPSSGSFIPTPPSDDTTVTIDNLKLDNTVGSSKEAVFSAYDSNGVPHPFKMQFTNSSTNEWNVTITQLDASVPAMNAVVRWDAGSNQYKFTSVNGVALATPSVIATWTDGYKPTSNAMADLTFSLPANVSAPDVGTFKFVNQTPFPPTQQLEINTLQLDNSAGSVQDKYFTVIDANGNPRVFKMTLTQDGNNKWNFAITEPGATGTTITSGGTGTITYDSVAGTYSLDPSGMPFTFTVTGKPDQQVKLVNTDPSDDIAPATGTFSMSSNPAYLTSAGKYSVYYMAADGKPAMNIDFDMSKITQFSGGSTVQIADQNGYGSGTLDKISFNTSGQIIGRFSNGQTMTLAQVALANFNNPGGLTKYGDTLYAQSSNSGLPQIGTAETGGRGKITPGTLEMSNVDLSLEFSNMIMTQRGFQTNSKIITVVDEMLQELANLKR